MSIERARATKGREEMGKLEWWGHVTLKQCHVTTLPLSAGRGGEQLDMVTEQKRRHKLCRVPSETSVPHRSSVYVR